MMTAFDCDAAVATHALGQDDFKPIRDEMVGGWETRFDVAVARNDWPTAGAIASTAASFERRAEKWLPAAVKSSPPIRNSVGMLFHVIPPGEFEMGSRNGVRRQEGPAHQVAISKFYFIGVYEVTEADWAQVMGKSNGVSLRPVADVTWEEAQAFCAALSSLPAEQSAGRVYRLPTEAEWEYACRAGSTTTYSFGNNPALLREYAWFDENSGGQRQVVGQKKPNGWGLYDMHGNVFEWCSDYYGDYQPGAVTDPSGPADGSDRVLRGSFFLETAQDVTSTNRNRSLPAADFGILGFRVVLDPFRGSPSVPKSPSPQPSQAPPEGFQTIGSGASGVILPGG